MTPRGLPAPTPTGRLGRLLAVGVLLLATAVGLAQDPPANDPGRFAFDKDRQFLLRVRDRQPLRITWVEGEEATEREPFEAVALHAHGFAADELLAAARRDVSYGNMMSQDDLYREEVRFELVRVEGKLKRLQRMGTTPTLKQAGIGELYEAWIFPNEVREPNPVCVILTEPPAGVEPASDITPMIRVSTAGYFFKIVEYPSNDPNPKDKTRTLYRRAPLLVGKTAVVTPEPENPPSVAANMVTVSFILGGVLLVVLVGMSVWLRRTDRGARRAAALRRTNPYDAPPQPPPGGPAEPL